MNSCLIEVKLGERVKKKGSEEEGTLVDIRLSPNGMNRPELVATLYVKLDKGVMSCSTSEHWECIESYPYSEFFPSVHLNKLCDDEVKHDTGEQVSKVLGKE